MSRRFSHWGTDTLCSPPGVNTLDKKLPDGLGLDMGLKILCLFAIIRAVNCLKGKYLSGVER